MSYWTEVQLVWLGDELTNAEGMRGDLEKIVAAAQYSEDVVADLMQLLVEGSASILSSEIAKLVPDRSFSVRGWGESVRDVWLRDYDGGKEIFSLGPPEGAV